MRLITWNVARRSTRLGEQAVALASRSPDVVCLQEVTAKTEPAWLAAFELMGLQHVALARGERRHRVLLASSEPLQAVDALALPWPDSTVAARTHGVEVHCVHVPNAANGWTKPETLEAIRAGLAERTGRRVLCGDLNTPRKETPDGSVISFARDRYERLRPERGERWEAAELGVVPGLREIGFTDCFRALHGYESREPSWVYPRFRKSGYRLDHVFCSAELTPRSCAYHHAWRDSHLSDHSALEVDLS